jgi:hypothetical protein
MVRLGFEARYSGARQYIFEIEITVARSPTGRWSRFDQSALPIAGKYLRPPLRGRPRRERSAFVEVADEAAETKFRDDDLRASAARYR